jgi:hypothetical protein
MLTGPPPKFYGTRDILPAPERRLILRDPTGLLAAGLKIDQRLTDALEVGLNLGVGVEVVLYVVGDLGRWR